MGDYLILFTTPRGTLDMLVVNMCPSRQHAIDRFYAEASTGTILSSVWRRS